MSLAMNLVFSIAEIARYVHNVELFVFLKSLNKMVVCRQYMKAYDVQCYNLVCNPMRSSAGGLVVIASDVASI